MMAVQTERKYSVWVTGTYRKKGKRQVLIGDELDLLREYAKQQKVAAEVRTTRTGAKMWPRENGRA